MSSSPAGPARSGPRWSARWWRPARSATCPTCTRPRRSAFRCAITRRVKLVAGIDLTDESAVARLYDGVPKLWASIHLAGGFAMAPVGKTTKADLMQQIEMNFVTAFLCCRAAVQRHRAHRRGRTHRQRGGAPGARMAQPAPAWRPMRRARPRSRRSRSRSPRRWRRTASWSMRSRPRSWTRRPTAPPCPRPTTRPGRRSRRSRRRSCFWPRPTTRSRAAASCRCTGES